MKILVTGAGGQLGKELQQLCSTDDGNQWIFLRRKDFDIANSKDIEKLGDHNPDIVINCAAYTQVDKAENDVFNCWETNALGPGRLARKCAALNCWLIHISSDYVYHHNPGRPFKEEDPVYPRGVYAASKAGGELLIRHFAKNAIIIRTSWLYGNEGPNFVRTMLRLASQRSHLNVVNDQLGAPTFTYDLAKAIRKIIRTLKEKPSEGYGGIYHFANEGIVSWFGFAEAIMNECQKDTTINPIPTSSYPSPAPRPGWSIMSMGKIKRVFDVYPPHWRISLKKYLSSASTEIND